MHSYARALSLSLGFLGIFIILMLRPAQVSAQEVDSLQRDSLLLESMLQLRQDSLIRQDSLASIPKKSKRQRRKERKAQEILIQNTQGDSVAQGPFLKRLLFPGKRPPYDPSIAWKRSLIFPGWGQIYNKSYWKLPFVYGAYAGMGYAIYFNNNEYQRFRTAFRVRVDDDPNTVDTVFDPNISDDGIKAARDRARRNRDYMIIMTLAVHMLQVVEAYVDAHLKGFDVSQDLGFEVRPSLLNPVQSPQIPVMSPYQPGVQFAISF